MLSLDGYGLDAFKVNLKPLKPVILRHLFPERYFSWLYKQHKFGKTRKAAVK